MITKLVLLFMLGHVLGDFYFQTDSMAKEKEEKFKGVLKHSLEYFVAILFVMLPVVSLNMIKAAIMLSSAHFFIDGVKYGLIKLKKIRKSGKIFVYDQILHIISIFLLAYMMYCGKYEIIPLHIIKNMCMAFGINKVMTVKWILSVLILYRPANILIQKLLSGYKPQKDDRLITIDYKVGRMVGGIERLIMFMFIAMDQYAAMGLVLTAKSIARYDKIAKDEQFAEYYLLGTLLSTACAVLCKIVLL